MHEFRYGTTRDAVPYVDLIRQFTSGKISAQEFETAYLELFQSGDKILPDSVEGPLNEIFYAVEDYVSDPELRAEVDGLDDEQVRERATVQLRLLVEAVETGDQQGGQNPEQSQTDSQDLGEH